MSAYSETYVSRAQDILGCALQTGTSVFGMGLHQFFELFLASAYAEKFAAGDVSIIAGRSGSELALMIAQSSGKEVSGLEDLGLRQTSGVLCMPTPEYWAGWALAYYQWASALTFSQIECLVPIEDVRALYSPYHEMDIRAFCEEMDRLLLAAQPDTPLKSARVAAGLSQSELAMLSGVPVRSIQQYEQRQKSLNRAGVQTVFALSHALCCDPGALLDHSAASTYQYALVRL